MYELDVLIQGFPGKTAYHGGLGWSTVALLRGEGHSVLLDTGGYNCRDLLVSKLRDLGLEPAGVTDVVLSHCHWDHILNFPLFTSATVHVPASELAWASQQPTGTWYLPELHVERLASDPHVHRFEDGDEVLPDLRALATPGHTPGHSAFVTRTSSGPLLIAADAVKNQAELVTGRTDLTLDAEQSRRSIEKIRDLASQDPATTIVCGHDRLLGIEGGQVVYRSELAAALKARLSADFDAETVFDLTAAVGVR
ncbi:MAG: MBL fold metallo-hydrolase [bacterium]|nr:MBL fold metallo-hydrolase [bacterium]